MNVIKSPSMIRFPVESEEGSIEYKYQLTDNKKHHKIYSQITFRVNEGNGVGYFYVGMTDNGWGIGITQEMMDKTLVIITNAIHHCKYNITEIYLYPGYYDEHYVLGLKIEGKPVELDYSFF